jgi:uncharacterized protein with HEPN domain
VTVGRPQMQRILDIRDAIARIAAYASLGRDRFQEDELVQVWMVHQLETIGEAAAGVSSEVRERFPSVEWRLLSDMRNRLTHGYFDIDMVRVWETVERDIPPLGRQMDGVLAAWGDDPRTPHEGSETA